MPDYGPIKMIETQSATQQFLTGVSMATVSRAFVIETLNPNYLQDVCSCNSCCDCCVSEYALHDLIGVDNFKNDKFSFIFKKDFTGDGYSFKLYKRNATGADTEITINSSIATIYDYGDLESEDLYGGFIIDWYLVYSTNGNGDYYISGTVTKQGQEFDYESHTFKVRTFSCLIANNTVKIQAIQNGYIMSEDMDLSGFEWPTSIRVNGRLTKEKPDFITDRYTDGKRVIKQIQDEISDNWKLELWNMATKFNKLITYNLILNNEFYVSDYNRNEQKYDYVSLVVEGIDKRDLAYNSSQVDLTLKLKNRTQNIIKRNFNNVFTNEDAPWITYNEVNAILWT